MYTHCNIPLLNILSLYVRKTSPLSNIACKSSSVWISGKRSLWTDDELNPTFGSEPNSSLYGDCPITRWHDQFLKLDKSWILTLYYYESKFTAFWVETHNYYSPGEYTE